MSRDGDAGMDVKSGGRASGQLEKRGEKTGGDELSQDDVAVHATPWTALSSARARLAGCWEPAALLP
jgi:hypothetical protein